MELRQLHSLDRLHLVQSAVSQHLARLEGELGTQIFVRKGKRLIGLTAAGETILNYARQALAIRENILAVGRDHVEETVGDLRIGTTHAQARYILPPVIRRFRGIIWKIHCQG